MVEKIVNNDISKVKEDAVALIDFSAVWCGPCKMLAPVLDELAEEMDGKVSFYNADVDANMDLAQEFGITNIPALVLLKNGEAIDQTVGFQPKDSLKAFIEKQL